MERSGEAVAPTCHNFSDIRRRPLVIGKLDQVRLPFVVTMPQLAVGAITFGLLFLTRPAWGAIMSDRLHIVTFVVVPIVVAQQVSRTSIEGRTVSKAALGFFRLWLAPTRGEINGSRRRPATTTRVQLRPLLPQPPLDERSTGRTPNRSNRRSPNRSNRSTRPSSNRSTRRSQNRSNRSAAGTSRSPSPRAGRRGDRRAHHQPARTSRRTQRRRGERS